MAHGGYFQGNWKMGAREGLGTEFVDGSLYEGGWSEGVRSGFGVLSDLHGAQPGWWERGSLVFLGSGEYMGGRFLADSSFSIESQDLD